MTALAVLALLLELSPLLAFGCLAVLHPVGDPQASASLLVRLLDYQGTYWLRHGLPVPPPLLVIGFLTSLALWWRDPSGVARIGTRLGLWFLGFWALIAVVPLLVHVN